MLKPIKTSKPFTIKPELEIAPLPISIEPAIPRGMETVLAVAHHYGFKLWPSPRITRDDLARGKALKVFEEESPEYDFLDVPEEKTAFLRAYIESGLNAYVHPVMAFYKRPMPGIKGRKPSKEKQFALEILGSSRSIVEATLIKTARAILEEEGYPDIFVEVNSIGDKDAISKFDRELNVHYRKQASSMPGLCRQAFKKDAFNLLQYNNKDCDPYRASAPKSISFLSEANREHFKEVLEYMEILEIPYQINNSLVGNRAYCSQMIFRIKNNDKHNTVLATGYRYDSLAKKMGLSRKEIASAGIILSFKRVLPESDKKITIRVTKKPKFFLVQLGFEAKLKSLMVIELLRKAKIAISHALTKDKLVAQLSIAENNKFPYILIMGQKEAVEGTVVVRDMTTRSQETVPIDHLPKYLEKIK
ncbi:MAG: His/Gly/Thr/Pro-type tRNA ligase C-terminal domain-containing protein [bacterium]|nr:His/Gly/Thr/Pro-type tRNA ligase C-terminal domain-containing protein [bacterium]